MRDFLGWDVSLGRLAGVRVQLHFFFLLFAVLALHQATVEGQSMAWHALAGLAWLLFSTLAHEMAHVQVARRLGATDDAIVLWPLGGLTYPQVTGTPLGELAVATAGLLVNAALCVVTGTAVLALGGLPALTWHPFAPPAAADQLSWLQLAQLGFWTNWVLVLVNLLPAAPLDGGRILRALLWPYVGARSALVRVAQLAKITAVLLCLAGWFLRDPYPFAWVPLALLGIFVYFSARQELERLQDTAGDRRWPSAEISDPPLELAATSRAEPAIRTGSKAGRVEDRAVSRTEALPPSAEDEERRVDDILARLHERGMSAISAEERALLDRVSARYRQRQGR